MRMSTAIHHRIVLCLAMLLIFSSACSKRDKQAQPDAGTPLKILRLGNGSEPQDLDPHIVTGVTEHNIIAAVIEGLVSEDPKTLDPVPGVASRWEISEDGRTYTFYLREEARWSNGDPVTAQDFVFSYKRMLAPGLGAPYAYMLYLLMNGEAYNKGSIDNFERVGVHAFDDHTLKIILEAPTPYFLAILNHYSWFPVHPPTILQHGDFDQRSTGWTRPGTHVGNGPYVLASWKADKKITVTRSPTYWDRATVKIDEIHFHPIGDHATEERTFRSGQLHVTSTIPIDRIEHYRRNQPDLLRLDPYLGTYYYVFNVKRKPLDDPRVRRALSMSIDRVTIVERVTKAGEDPAYYFTPPGTAGFRTDARIADDVEAARKLLAEAGYPGGEGFPTLKLLYNTSDAHERIAQVIQQMWKKALGIEIALENMEWKVYLDATQRGKYDIARAGWIGDYVDPNSFLDMWITDGGNNRADWSNPEYDGLIRAASTTLDPVERFKYFSDAEKILARESPIMPIYTYRSKSLVQPSVLGWHPTILDHHPYKHLDLK